MSVKYLNGDNDYNRHVETLKQKNNVSVINGEVTKIGYRYECILSNVNLSQYSVENHFKTKIHLCKVNGITKEGILT